MLYRSNLVRIPPEIGAMTSLEEFTPYTSYRLHWFPRMVEEECGLEDRIREPESDSTPNGRTPRLRAGSTYWNWLTRPPPAGAKSSVPNNARVLTVLRISFRHRVISYPLTGQVRVSCAQQYSVQCSRSPTRSSSLRAVG